jgi:hypothetical protein
MIDAGFSLHYSDLVTLAGLQRIFAPANMPPVTAVDAAVAVTVGVRIERDDRVPAGMVEVRWKDGRREIYDMPLTKPRPLGARS